MVNANHPEDESLAGQTVKDRLETMRLDLIALAHCCNRDHQYDEAAKIQTMLVTMRQLDIQCADVAAWPPKVDVDSGGDSCWACIDG
jgi:hypothetical protein